MRCGRCYAPTPFYNHSWFNYVLVAMCIVLLALAAIGFVATMLEPSDVAAAYPISKKTGKIMSAQPSMNMIASTARPLSG
ncbi:hypothetical protein SSE37_04925 [Sagittula stellata E-37]|uniref:Uncharacterized protein n=1 Tax=Sagittula stellata (strain ATCC 700073 / DSM 11524 / E-37) TaxID=388399 RepID=A3K215_SAGS3|nr:hypothetical protein SSE37_04925 [Sagittula stellata E-37]